MPAVADASRRNLSHLPSTFIWDHCLVVEDEAEVEAWTDGVKEVFASDCIEAIYFYVDVDYLCELDL